MWKDLASPLFRKSFWVSNWVPSPPYIIWNIEDTGIFSLQQGPVATPSFPFFVIRFWPVIKNVWFLFQWEQYVWRSLDKQNFKHWFWINIETLSCQTTHYEKTWSMIVFIFSVPPEKETFFYIMNFYSLSHLWFFCVNCSNLLLIYGGRINQSTKACGLWENSG